MPQSKAIPVRDLAERIYVELVCRGIVITDTAAQIKSNPDSLAKISFKLADAFLRVAGEDKSAGPPRVEEFDMKATDLSSWGKTTP
ncbi:MAG: hypothetical protein ABI794_16950 [Betaproteobacteria bacterium]